MEVNGANPVGRPPKPPEEILDAEYKLRINSGDKKKFYKLIPDKERSALVREFIRKLIRKHSEKANH